MDQLLLHHLTWCVNMEFPYILTWFCIHIINSAFCKTKPLQPEQLSAIAVSYHRMDVQLQCSKNDLTK